MIEWAYENVDFYSMKTFSAACTPLVTGDLSKIAIFCVCLFLGCLYQNPLYCQLSIFHVNNLFFCTVSKFEAMPMFNIGNRKTNSVALQII